MWLAFQLASLRLQPIVGFSRPSRWKSGSLDEYFLGLERERTRALGPSAQGAIHPVHRCSGALSYLSACRLQWTDDHWSMEKPFPTQLPAARSRSSSCRRCLLMSLLERSSSYRTVELLVPSLPLLAAGGSFPHLGTPLFSRGARPPLFPHLETSSGLPGWEANITLTLTPSSP